MGGTEPHMGRSVGKRTSGGKHAGCSKVVSVILYDDGIRRRLEAAYLMRL